MRWVFGGVFTGRCSMDVQKYPFDVQKCSLQIGNRAHDRYTSDLKILSNGYSNIYQENTLWKPEGKPTTRRVYLSDVYPQLFFTFRWRRQPTYYELNLILPIVLLLAISCCVFWLPVESGEKIGLSMAVLITFSVFHSTVLQNTPMTSEEMPALSKCPYIF